MLYYFSYNFFLLESFFAPKLGLGRSLYGAQTMHSELKFVPYLGRPSYKPEEPLLQICFAHIFIWMRGVVNVYTDF